MDISNEKVFKVEYTSVLDGMNLKKTKWTSRIISFIRKNRILSIALLIFVMCVCMNLILVYNFMKLLQML